MTNLFENINDKNIEKLKRFLRTTTTTYPKNVNVLSNVNRDDYIAIIDKGSVNLIYNDYDGNKNILEELNEGELFGTLLSSITDEVECITKEQTQITYIDYSEITNDEIIKTEFYIIFIKNLIKLLSDQVKNKNKRIELLTKRTTRDKLLEYFRMKSQEKGNRTFSIPSSYTELASYLSVDRSAMMREITYLKEDGLITTNKRKITLLY